MSVLEEGESRHWVNVRRSRTWSTHTTSSKAASPGRAELPTIVSECSIAGMVSHSRRNAAATTTIVVSIIEIVMATPLLFLGLDLGVDA